MRVSSVVLPAMPTISRFPHKRSEDGSGTVLRLYETDGKPTDVKVSGYLVPAELCAHVGPFSVNTYYLADGSTDWREVLITEFDMNE